MQYQPAAAEVPPWYTQPAFTVAEIAQIIGAEEVTIRTWIARAAMRWLGHRNGNGRLTFSARDAYAFAVARDLIKFGTEFERAFIAAVDLTSGVPMTDVAAVRPDGDALSVKLTDDPHRLQYASIVVPLVAIYRRTIDAAAEVYGVAADA